MYLQFFKCKNSCGEGSGPILPPLLCIYMLLECSIYFLAQPVALAHRTPGLKSTQELLKLAAADSKEYGDHRALQDKSRQVKQKRISSGHVIFRKKFFSVHVLIGERARHYQG